MMMRFFAYRDSFDLRISYRQFLWDLSGKSCDLRKEMIVPKVPGAVNDSVAIPRSLFGWQPQSVSVLPVDWRFVGGLSGVQRADAAFVYGSWYRHDFIIYIYILRYLQLMFRFLVVLIYLKMGTLWKMMIHHLIFGYTEVVCFWGNLWVLSSRAVRNSMIWIFRVTAWNEYIMYMYIYIYIWTILIISHQHLNMYNHV